MKFRGPGRPEDSWQSASLPPGLHEVTPSSVGRRTFGAALDGSIRPRLERSPAPLSSKAVGRIGGCFGNSPIISVHEKLPEYASKSVHPTNPGAVAAAQATHEAVRAALSAEHSPIRGMKTDIFLQGSYRNGTNVRADSDSISSCS
jgi:hypothetical protein